jgi:hypothetical protein
MLGRVTNRWPCSSIEAHPVSKTPAMMAMDALRNSTSIAYSITPCRERAATK